MGNEVFGVNKNAEELAQKVGKDSEGWLYHLKVRENLKDENFHGEAAQADVGAQAHWLDHMRPDLREGHELGQIWNCDESWIDFRGIADYPHFSI